MDFTYVGNTVYGVLLAAAGLATSGASAEKLSGQAVFVTNGAPMPYWDFVAKLLAGLKYNASFTCRGYVPAAAGYCRRGLMVDVASCWCIRARPQRGSAPGGRQCGVPHPAHPGRCTVAQSAVHQAPLPQHLLQQRQGGFPSRLRGNTRGSHQHPRLTLSFAWPTQAKTLLGYKPLWSIDQGLTLTLRSFRRLRNPDAEGNAASDIDESQLPQCVPPTPPTTRVLLACCNDLWVRARACRYTAEEVARHTNDDDAWLIIDGKVYDVSDYVLTHPGGDAIMNNVGQDVSAGFHGPQHPKSVHDTVKAFLIGTLKK